LRSYCVSERFLDRQFISLWPNMFAETAVYHLTKL
jgi:hypothetical protein